MAITKSEIPTSKETAMTAAQKAAHEAAVTTARTNKTSAPVCRDPRCRTCGSDYKTPLASSLGELRARMRTPGCTYDWAELPTFGGEAPEDTQGVWSWDLNSLLVGTCADDLRIVPRRVA